MTRGRRPPPDGRPGQRCRPPQGGRRRPRQLRPPRRPRGPDRRPLGPADRLPPGLTGPDRAVTPRRYDAGMPPFELVSDFAPGGRPAGRDRGADPGAGSGGAVPDAAGDHRVGQVVHHRRGHRPGPAADARAGPQQEPGRPADQRVPGVLPQEPGRVLRLLLRLLPARGLHPVDRHLHREGQLDQRRDRPAAPLRHQRAAVPARRDHRRLGVGHLRPRRPRRVRPPAPHAGGGGGARPAVDPVAGWSTWATSATTSTSSATSSGSGATRSRCSRPTRSGPPASRCSATRSSGSSPSTRSPARSSRRSRSWSCSRPPTTWCRRAGWSGPSPRSKTS